MTTVNRTDDTKDGPQWKVFVRHTSLEVFGFFGEYRFLSNFWPREIVIDGVKYPTVENAYQASKFVPSVRSQFMEISPGDAKKLGQSNENRLRNDAVWSISKLYIMEELLYQKFRQVDLKNLLRATDNRLLVEANYWGDTFWGVSSDVSGVWVGDNMLGKILMRVRRSYM